MWLIMGRSVGAFLTLFLVLTLGGQETRTSYSRELLELVGYLYQRYSAAIVQTEEDSGRGVARGGQRRTKHDGGSPFWFPCFRVPDILLSGCCPRFIRCPSIVDKVGSMSLPPPALNSQNAKAALGTLLEESRTDSILLMQHLRELWTLDLSDSGKFPSLVLISTP
ncbi:hypothetical protein C8R47DRAFT_37146 [Mycena vitilis]|nr:hypothetical protein C8R47DRAFT_37146 [Mycena vitilis]